MGLWRAPPLAGSGKCGFYISRGFTVDAVSLGGPGVLVKYVFESRHQEPEFRMQELEYRMGVYV